METPDPRDAVPTGRAAPAATPPRAHARKIDCGRDPVPHAPRDTTRTGSAETAAERPHGSDASG